MKLYKKNFYIIFSVLFLIVSLAILTLEKTYPRIIHPMIWIIQAYFLTITCLTHFIAEFGLKKATSFHLYYMGAMTVRFLIALVFMLFFILFSREQPLAFVVNFFVLYILYTSFEIYFIIRNLRPD